MMSQRENEQQRASQQVSQGDGVIRASCVFSEITDD